MGLIKQTVTAAAEGGDGERRTERDYDGLLRALSDPDPTARRWAARDLLAYPNATGVLVAHLQAEQNMSVREVILTTLTCLHDPVAIAGLVACLRSEDAQRRNEAIGAMQSLPDQVGPIMGALLQDPDPDVRIMAVNVLESLRHPQVESWLIAVIEFEEDVNVCGTALDLLAEIGTRAAHAALCRLKRRFAAEPYIQFAADLTLRRCAKE